jgi:DNA-binding beta-propeller fold protein YncE
MQLALVTVGDLNHTKVYRQDKASDVPQLIRIIPSSGVTPHGIWTSADNTRIYYVNERSDTVDVVDTKTLEVRPPE